MLDEILAWEIEVSEPSDARSEEVPPDWFDETRSIAEKHQVDATLQFHVGDWINDGLALAEKHKTATLQWDIGDWFNGCPLPDDIPTPMSVPKAYEIAESVFGLPRGTLYDWASTARRIPLSVRTEKLSFTHHRVIANGLPHADDSTKKRWLEIAIDEKLSVRELKDKLRNSQSGTTSAPATKSFIVKLPVNLYVILQKIARGRVSNVQNIAAEFLTDYLASDDVAAMAEYEWDVAEKRTYERRRRAGIRTALAYDPLRLQDHYEKA